MRRIKGRSRSNAITTKGAVKIITVKSEKKRQTTYWWKSFTISSHEKDQKYDTKIRKSFDYVLTKLNKKYVDEPCFVDIIISRNTKTNVEFFQFKVRGKMLIREPESFKSQFTATFTHILRVKMKKTGEK